MYHLFRSLHRWVGLFASVFLLGIGVTGFLLATKGSVGWIRPPERQGQPVDHAGQIVSVQAATEVAFAQNLPQLQAMTDVDRVDYRPKSNVFKVVSKEGYHEVQVCGKTGEVLQVASRNDQLTEDIHDLSFVHGAATAWVLPLVAVCLTYLAGSGIGIFITPIVRRRRFQRRNAKS